MEPSSRPREKAYSSGMGSLSDAELLCLLLSSGSGKEGVVELSTRLLSHYGGIGGLAETPYLLLEREKGVGRAKSSLLGAAFELGKRAAQGEAGEFSSWLRRDVLSKEEEALYAYFLDRKKRVVGKRLLLLGSLSALKGGYKTVLSSLLYAPRGDLFLVHSHPSGVPLPSKEDIEFTSSCNEFLLRFGNGIKDHLILSKKGVFSFRENGLLS